MNFRINDTKHCTYTKVYLNVVMGMGGPTVLFTEEKEAIDEAKRLSSKYSDRTVLTFKGILRHKCIMMNPTIETVILEHNTPLSYEKSRHNTPWVSSEEKDLEYDLQQFLNKVGIKHGRSSGAIRERVKKILRSAV